ncbi:MAG TPA: hypothetical protein VGB61_09500 [Pyrinomonadaceae bacterium]
MRERVRQLRRRANNNDGDRDEAAKWTGADYEWRAGDAATE